MTASLAAFTGADLTSYPGGMSFLGENGCNGKLTCSTAVPHPKWQYVSQGETDAISTHQHELR
jgi:hypothetical protein